MQEKEINLIDYWNIIWKKRKFIVITVIVVTIISVGISLILPKWYKATAVMMPPATEEGQFGGLGANLSAFGLGGILGECLKLNENTPIEVGDMVFVPEKPEVDYWDLTKDIMTIAAQIATVVIVIQNVAK